LYDRLPIIFIYIGPEADFHKNNQTASFEDILSHGIMLFSMYPTDAVEWLLIPGY
jgi:hypothetical protein